jgi:hypothetical protein
MTINENDLNNENICNDVNAEAESANSREVDDSERRRNPGGSGGRFPGSDGLPADPNQSPDEQPDKLPDCQP